MREIEDVLHSLHISKNYKGYVQAMFALELALQDENRLLSVTKEIYMVVGYWEGTSWHTVERNLRTIVKRAWERNPELLERMARYQLATPPRVSEFLDIVSGYLQREVLCLKSTPP